MGVEYEHWLLPENRDLRPTTDAVANLVNALRRDRWVGDNDPGYASLFGSNDPKKVRRGRPIREPVPMPLAPEWMDARIDVRHPLALAREILLGFPIQIPDDDFTDWEDAAIHYPFTFGEDDPSNYHEISIYLADDFVSHDWTNAFDSAIDDTCTCGTKLGYDPSEDCVEYVAAIAIDGRIQRSCPSCGARFDPSSRMSRVRPGWDDTTEPLRGGVTFRFAVRIDCHKGWPRGQGRIRLKPAFRQLVEASIGEAFEDVGGLY